MVKSDNTAINLVIGNNIKKLIQSRGLYQNTFAESIGVSESTVGKWILGKTSPRMGVIQRISDLYNINKSDLLYDENFNPVISTESVDVVKKMAEMTPEEMKRLSLLIDIIKGGSAK